MATKHDHTAKCANTAAKLPGKYSALSETMVHAYINGEETSVSIYSIHTLFLLVSN